MTPSEWVSSFLTEEEREQSKKKERYAKDERMTHFLIKKRTLKLQ